MPVVSMGLLWKDLITQKLLLDHKITEVFSCVHMHTLFNVCSVHRDIRYILGHTVHWVISRVLQRMFIIMGDIMMHVGDILRRVGGYHAYIRAPWCMWGNIMSAFGGGDIMGTFFSVQHIGVFNIYFKRLLSISSSKAFHLPLRAIKHQLNCLLELTSGSSLTDRRDILVIPINHQECTWVRSWYLGLKN